MALASFSYIRISGERDRAVQGELAASKSAERATLSEQRALAGEAKAIEAQRKQWESAMSAAKQFALQTVELANVNQFDPAMRRADDAEIVAPGSPWHDFALGSIAMARRDYDDAVNLFRNAESRPDGNQPEIAAALADALARQGSLTDALAIIPNLEQVDDWRTLLGAGRVLYSSEKWEECQRPLSRAIKLMELEQDRPSDDLAEAKRLLEAAPAQFACVGFYEEIRHLPLAQQEQRVLDKLAEIHQRELPFLVLTRNTDGRIFFGSSARKFELRHLYPIKGLPIQDANLHSSSVWDLSPLRGMPLERLVIGECREVTSLEAIEDSTSLVEVICAGTGITELSSLRKLPLKKLNCWQLQRSLDLTPLRDMPLEELRATTFDLEPLRGMPLKHLDITNSNVQSLEALRGMSLETLVCNATAVSDLSPLADMPLRELDVSLTQVADLSPVRSCPIARLDLTRTPVNDINPLAGLPLIHLYMAASNVHDISPVRGMPLKHLDVSYTNVTDLSALTGAKLETLDVIGCLIKDYAPLTTLADLQLNDATWASFLVNELSEREFREKMLSLGTERKQNPEVTLKHIVLFIAMKRYGDDGPRAAIPVLEQYIERWGALPPTRAKPKYIEEQLQHLRDELVEQSRPSDN